MSEQNFFVSYLQVLAAIDHCEENNMLPPALVLLYSAIDSVSWLASNNHKESGKAFRQWVSDWMLTDPKITCSADELYAARCGLVHTLTPTSTLNQKGVRKISYSWGKDNDNQILERLIQHFGQDHELVSVHLSDLVLSFRNGMADYLQYVYQDPERIKAFEEKCGQHFASISREQVDDVMKTLGLLDTE